MPKKFSLIFVIVMLVIGLAFPLSTSAKNVTLSEIPDPIPFQESEPLFSTTGKANNGNTETPGEWYIGSTPPNLIPNSPILLFVPGLNNVAQVFYEENDMYQTAYNAGYQTTFIQLYDAGGASADMWDNGALLADKIREISNHFGGKPITVVAYSKGGVDTQTALTYYGAWQYVNNVITLSSPHHGSQLADLAYSSGAGWLADLLGAQGDGTYSMQMGYMADFRAQTDDQPRAYYNDYYTLGGTAWGSAFSSNWYGGVYLSQYGSNDGVVTTASSRLPGGQQLAIGDWTHTTIRTGVTFPVFDDYLTDNTYYNIQMRKTTGNIDRNSPSYNQWVDGGPLLVEKENELVIPVEDGVKEVTLNLLTSRNLADAKLTSPSGKVVTPKFSSTKIEEGIFLGAIQNTLTYKKPEAGEWKLELTVKEEDAYLLVTSFNSSTKLQNAGKVKASNSMQMTYHLTANTEEVQENTLTATYHITESNNPVNSKKLSVAGSKNLSKVLTFNTAKEVYNITIEVEGLTKNGKPFKRTIIDSVYVE
ncbi:esterase/lipase family protein [Ornithinibacillus californiensis]|uniref:esterase/lipase family protein n=1 Tax=Ornithinibacillus californiensis TaxID=161536 RepID=UPI00064D85DC|nr:hypothetical protein [Ornithinibacillus californiensis]